jgi:hypothetical protein
MASAFKTSLPLRMPPSTQTSQAPPTWSMTWGRASQVEGAVSSWRPPWLLTITAFAPCSAERRASSPRQTPLTTTGSSVVAHSQSRSSKLSADSKCVRT